MAISDEIAANSAYKAHTDPHQRASGLSHVCCRGNRTGLWTLASAPAVYAPPARELLLGNPGPGAPELRCRDTQPTAVRVLALWRYGMALTRSCGHLTVATWLALLMRQKVATVAQRLYAW